MGMEVAADGKILSLKSNSSQQNRLANGGVYLVHPRVLSDFKFASLTKVSLEDDMLPVAIEKQRLYGVEFQGDFIDIGLPDDYHRSAELLN